MRAVASAVLVAAGAYLWTAGIGVWGGRPGAFSEVAQLTLGMGALLLLVGLIAFMVAFFSDRPGSRGPWPDLRE